MPGGYSARSVNNAPRSQIELNVALEKVWSGKRTAHRPWDTSAFNWNGGPAKFDTDTVLFDDNGSGSVTVAGGVTVLPAWSRSKPRGVYIFSGNGNIGGGTSLLKQNTGMLTISMPNNTYSGGTMLGGGILEIAADSTVSGGSVTAGPLGTGTLTLSGGTLQDDGGAAAPWPTPSPSSATSRWAAAGANGLNFSGPNTVAITGAPVITVTAPTIIDEPITGDTLVKDGPSTLTVTAATNNYTPPPWSRAARWWAAWPAFPRRSPWPTTPT